MSWIRTNHLFKELEKLQNLIARRNLHFKNIFTFFFLPHPELPGKPIKPFQGLLSNPEDKGFPHWPAVPCADMVGIFTSGPQWATWDGQTDTRRMEPRVRVSRGTQWGLICLSPALGASWVVSPCSQPWFCLQGTTRPLATPGSAGCCGSPADALREQNTVLLPTERRLTPGLEVLSVNQLFNHLLLSLKKKPLLTLLEISFLFSL